MNQIQLNTEQDIILLNEYLSKLYSPEHARVLITQHQNNLFGKNSLSYSLGKRSLPYFCLYYLQDIFRVKPDNNARELAPFHYELWETLEDMIIEDSFDKLVLCLPRGHAKSTVITYALVIWLACYEQSFYTIVQGKTEADAQKFIFDVRTTFEQNENLKNTFGELIDTKFTINKNELHLANNCKIEALSSSTSLRGRKHLNNRPTYLICDDIAGLDDCLTQQSKDKKLETYQKDVLYAGDTPVYRDGKKIKSGSKYIVLGTVLAEGDFISSLLADKSYHHVFKRGIPLDDFDVDEYFTSGLWKEFKDIYFNPKNPYAQIDAKDFYLEYEQEMAFPVLWEDKYSCYDLAIMYYSNPQGFKSEIMNDATRIGAKVFHHIKTMPADEIEQQNYVKTILCCDPAVEVSRTNDYTALCVGSKAHNNFRYVRKGIIDRFRFDDYIDKIISLLQEYPEIDYVWIEKNTYNGTDEAEVKKRIKADKLLKRRNITVISQRQFKNKDAKIRSIAGKVDSGFIIFNEDDAEFYNQVLEYNEFAKWDDAPDVLAEFDRLIEDAQATNKLEFMDIRQLF